MELLFWKSDYALSLVVDQFLAISGQGFGEAEQVYPSFGRETPALSHCFTAHLFWAGVLDMMPGASLVAVGLG